MSPPRIVLRGRILYRSGVHLMAQNCCSYIEENADAILLIGALCLPSLVLAVLGLGAHLLNWAIVVARAMINGPGSSKPGSLLFPLQHMISRSHLQFLNRIVSRPAVPDVVSPGPQKMKFQILVLYFRSTTPHTHYVTCMETSAFLIPL